MIQTVPDVTFKTRVRDESIGGENPFRWLEHLHPHAQVHTCLAMKENLQILNHLA